MTHFAQEKLKQSLILLLDDFDFNQILISKTCKEAGVHRFIFYAYYDNQSDSLEDAMAYLADIFTAEFASLQETFKAEKERDSLPDSYYLLPYLTCIKDRQKLYKIYLKNPIDFQHEKVVEQHTSEQFLNRYHAKGFTGGKMICYMTHLYIAGIRRITYDWVTDGCHDDITYIIKIIHTIIFQEGLLETIQKSLALFKKHRLIFLGLSLLMIIAGVLVTSHRPSNVVLVDFLSVLPGIIAAPDTWLIICLIRPFLNHSALLKNNWLKAGISITTGAIYNALYVVMSLVSCLALQSVWYLIYVAYHLLFTIAKFYTG